MIVSILNAPDLRNPRLAFAIALYRQRQTHSVALLDATSASQSQWDSERLAASAASCIPVVRASRQCLQPALDALAGSCRDIVIDIDEAASFAGRSALVAARVLVLAMAPVDWQDEAMCMALTQRIERTQLFNPTLRILVVPVRYGTTLSDAQRADLYRFVQRLSGARLAHRGIGDLGELRALARGKSGAGSHRDLAALCAELFPQARLQRWSIPGLANAAGTQPRFP